MKVIALCIAAVVYFQIAFAQTGTPVPTEPKVGERLASFEMAWAKRSEQEVLTRATALTELIVERKLKEAGMVSPIKSPEGVARRWNIGFPEAADLHIRYLPSYDEIRIFNFELAADLYPKTDIKDAAALEIAKKHFKRLVEKGILDDRHYDWKRADIGYAIAGQGSLDGSAKEEYRRDYRITLRRVINGIEVANAGVRFAIHATGKFSGLRLGGVTIESKFEKDFEAPTGAGKILKRNVSTEEIERRFRETIPKNMKADVAWSRLLYVMPEDKERAVVEPFYVFSYSLQMPTEEGQTVVSRRKMLAFSVIDPKVRPIDLTPPAGPAATTEPRRPEPTKTKE